MTPKGKVLWFTGLSGAGKTTIAEALHAHLMKVKCMAVVLDGDLLRKGLNTDLGFSAADRSENIRRIAEIAKLLVHNGIVCIVSTISPYAELREKAKEIIGQELFSEIFINAPLQVCEERDVKGLYGKARRNQIASFTGIHDDYMPPVNPDLEIRTDLLTPDESVRKIIVWFNNLVNTGLVGLQQIDWHNV
ncbi:adenylyl-sulfate kinase [Niastella yeongjuensis]|uniref:Adenylyl-sulfate kinase n=1 Tax=Niastella yeongjuensis TaxID=354355 RepID=A0A1V9EI94_9BACT|nr:adenylyl-sulfate kinase [Niastella yeongjuensis]OQP45858.1 adenylyl-sulfate kinase [Niastella yeongjuensis]SEP46663.1 adenylylsulfate kinase [Niastella yeongjuensis]